MADILSLDVSEKAKKVRASSPFKYWRESFKKGGITFDTLYAEDLIIPEGLPIFCRSYNKSLTVQNYFWKFNEEIISFLGEDINYGIYGSAKLRKFVYDLINKASVDIKEIYRKKKEFPSSIMSYTSYILGEINGGIVYSGKENVSSADSEKEKQVTEFAADLIISEYEAPEDTYRIYREENKTKGLDTMKKPVSCLSFSDGAFGGIVRDIQTGAAFTFALKCKNMLCMDLSKKDLLRDSKNTPFFIPQIICMETVLGSGEYHHVRSKKIELAEKIQTFTDFQAGPGADKESMPWYYIDSEKTFKDFLNNYEISVSERDRKVFYFDGTKSEKMTIKTMKKKKTADSEH